METRSLGQTGLKVTPVGLGLAALGRPGYINLGHGEDLAGDYDRSAMERRAHMVLQSAYDRGVRYFDAARSYGLAEKFLASWLDRFEPRDVTIGSKWGYTYTADWQVQAKSHEVKDHSLPVLRRQWGESLALLKDHLNLYQIHSATIESGVLENAEVLNELARLKAIGVRIGISLSGPDQAAALRQALEARVDGALLFDVVQATWNLMEQSAGPALLEASRAGLGVIIKEALANGRLTERNTALDFSLPMLKRAATQLGTDVDAIALAACLAEPFADVVLSGATTINQLESNLRAPALTLSEETRRELLTLAEEPQKYWATRKQMVWN
jgi:aryl-alcohol dehydrogenase-like predicted oxidoreductase